MSSINVKKLIRDLLRGTYSVTGYYGLPDLVANTNNILWDIYSDQGYSATEIRSLAEWFAARKEFPVLAEFPRTTKDLPAVFVFRLSDNETDRGLVGDLLGVDETYVSEEQVREIYGVLMDEQIALRIWATGDGAMRDDIYLAVRELLLRGRGFFAKADVLVEWKNGRDGQLYDPQAEPHIIHTAEATLVCKTSIQWPTTGEMLLDVQSRARDPEDDSGEVDAEPYEEYFP